MPEIHNTTSCWLLVTTPVMNGSQSVSRCRTLTFKVSTVRECATSRCSYSVSDWLCWAAFHYSVLLKEVNNWLKQELLLHGPLLRHVQTNRWVEQQLLTHSEPGRHLWSTPLSPGASAVKVPATTARVEITWKRRKHEVRQSVKCIVTKYSDYWLLKSVMLLMMDAGFISMTVTAGD